MNNIRYYLYFIIGKKYPVFVVCIMIFMLFYYLLIMPLQKQLNEFKSEELRIQHQYNQQIQQINELARDKQQLDKLLAKWQQLQHQGITLKEINTVFAELESLAKHADVHLTYETEHPLIKISIESDYLSLLYFLDGLINKPYFLIDDLQLKRESGWITTTLHLNILLAEDHG